MDINVIPVTFVTVWNGEKIESQALLDCHSGEVFAIQTRWEREFIRLDNGNEFDVEEDGGTHYIKRPKVRCLQ